MVYRPPICLDIVDSGRGIHDNESGLNRVKPHSRLQRGGKRHVGTRLDRAVRVNY
jgi:hypothetical protein